MDLKEVSLYIDTSIRGPRKKQGAFGYVLEAITAAGPATRTCVVNTEGESTEHRTLAIAIQKALKRLNQQCQLVLYTDCEYIGAVFSQGWLSEWYYSGWKTKKGTEVANAEIWQEIFEIVRHIPVQVRVKEEHIYKEWLRHEVTAVAAGKAFTPL